MMLEKNKIGGQNNELQEIGMELKEKMNYILK